MWTVLRRYYQFVLQYPTRFGLYLLVAVVSSGIDSSLPYFFKLFIDAIQAEQLNRLWWLLGLLIGLRLVVALGRALQYQLADWFVIPAARNIRTTVFKKVQALDFAYHMSKSTGSLISAFKRGDNAIFRIHDIIDQRMLEAVIQLVVLLLFLSQAHLVLSGIMLLAVCLNSALAVWLIRYNVSTRTRFNDAEDELSAVITDNLLNYETVKLFAKEVSEQHRLRHYFAKWSSTLWDYALSFRVIEISVGILSNVSFGLVMAYAVQQFLSGQISTGDLVMILGFLSSFMWRFFEMVFELRNLATNQTDAEKYLSILDEQEQVLDPTTPTVPTHVQGGVAFENVSFTYNQAKDALRNFDLHIKPGQTVALVGHSGAGKSTVVKLLLRFFDPDTGQITIDGVDIRNMTKSQLRSLMGVVPQDPILFNTTIKHNICYGSGEVDNQTMIAAAKMANVDQFVQELPEKYDAQVGERGVKLSGGQKQRLAIARMMLANPNIVIFDEATSQLDSESEQQIQEAFWKVTSDKTTLIIAHRLSTVVKADKIVVMDNGKVVEVGSHRDLLRRGGQYAQFWKLQTLEV